MFSLSHICSTRERERESARATVCILHDAGAIALGIRVALVDELLHLHHLVQSLLPLSTLILELLQISREPWSIVGRLQLWNTSTSTSSVADLQRDHRTIDCLAVTDGAISISCSVASLHTQFLGQLVQVSILCLCSPDFSDSFENMRNGGLCVISRAHSQHARFRILDARGHWISIGLKQFWC